MEVIIYILIETKTFNLLSWKHPGLYVSKSRNCNSLIQNCLSISAFQSKINTNVLGQKLVETTFWIIVWWVEHLPVVWIKSVCGPMGCPAGPMTLSLQGRYSLSPSSATPLPPHPTPHPPSPLPSPAPLSTCTPTQTKHPFSPPSLTLPEELMVPSLIASFDWNCSNNSKKVFLGIPQRLI